MVIVDTSVVIDYLRQEDKTATPFETLVRSAGRDALGISILTVQELFAGRSMDDKKNQDFLAVFLVSVRIFPYNLDVAKKAGELSRLLGKRCGFVDPAIAATAIINKAQLATLNSKDFAGIPNLELLKLPVKSA